MNCRIIFKTVPYIGTIGTLFLGTSLLAVYANPMDGEVVSGVATIQENGKKLDIYQQTDKAIIDWRRFNIDVDEHTEFHQPSHRSVVLNRVKGSDPSQILGRLSANGNVVLVNPNGIFFGTNSRVDVNGLIATTADINNQDFMDGKLEFNKAGNPDAMIINEGLITAKESGLVGLVAPNVINSGIIYARLGRVELASGDAFAIDLYGDGLYQLSVSDDLVSQLVSNTGLISAEGGTIAITAAAARDIVDSLIQIEGELHAPVIGNQGGEIYIKAEGSNGTEKQGNSTVIVNNAILDASGRTEGQQGGNIEILADQIAIDNTIIDASGTGSASMAPISDDNSSATLTADKGVRTEEEFLNHENRTGGSIKIGGDYLGTGETQRAKTTIVSRETIVLNDAIENGDAGRTIIWSDGYTEFGGTVQSTAKNGADGFVETSGKEILQATGFVDAGLWLLDPNNITIQDAGSDTNVNLSPNFTSTNDSAIVTTASIESALNAGTDVLVKTTSSGTNAQDGDITVNNNIDKTSGTAATLTLEADNSIFVNSNITSTSNALNVTLTSDADGSGAGSITLTNANITSNGGNITLGGGYDPDGVGTDYTAQFAKGTATDDDGIELINSDLIAGAGNIALYGEGRDDYGNSSGLNGISLTNSLLSSTSGNITLYGMGGDGTSDNYGVYLFTNTAENITSVDGNIDIIGIGGDGSSHANFGIYLRNLSTTTSANITSTGVGVNAATISLNGMGGNGTTLNYGIYLRTDNSAENIISIDGDVDIIGRGNGTSNTNYGIYLLNASTATASNIASTGVGSDAAEITLNGTGGEGTSINYGVYLRTNASENITSVDGDIDIIGVGGNGSVNSNKGIYLLNSLTATASNIASTGVGSDSAEITLHGTGGEGVSTNYGIHLNSFANPTVASVDGNIVMTGIGSNTAIGGDNDGIFLQNSAEILTTGSANITLSGLAGMNTSYGLATDTTVSEVGGASATGNITLNFDNYSLTASPNFQTTGTVTFAPYTDAYNMSISGNDVTINGVTTTNLLSDVHSDVMGYGFGTSSTTGDISIAARDWGTDNLTAITQGSVSFSDEQTNINSLLVDAGGDITLNNTISTTNDAILSAGGNFINNVDESVLNGVGGRWVVYSTDPANNTRGGLLPDASIFNQSYPSYTPSADGNDYFIYSTATQPILTYTVSDDTVIYGNAYSGTPSMIISGLVGDDTIANIGQTGTEPVYDNTDYVIGDNVGSYNLNGSSGTLSNPLGYTYNVVSGTLTVDQRELEISSVDVTDSKIYDASTATNINNINFSNIFGSDDVDITGATAAFIDANVGIDKNVNLTLGSLTGTASGNYSLPTTITNLTSDGDITARALTITANDSSITYGDVFTLGQDGYSQVGLQGGDSISTSDYATNASISTGGHYEYNATPWEITPSNVSFGSGLASNYSISYATGELTIARKLLTLGTVDVADKVYDANNSASLNSIGFTGLEAGDVVSSYDITGNITTFDDINVGTDKTVSITGATGLVGADSNNYTLPSLVNVTSTGDITANNTIPRTVEFVSQNPETGFNQSTDITIGEQNFFITQNNNFANQSGDVDMIFTNTIEDDDTLKNQDFIIEIHPDLLLRYTPVYYRNTPQFTMVQIGKKNFQDKMTLPTGWSTFSLPTSLRRVERDI